MTTAMERLSALGGRTGGRPDGPHSAVAVRIPEWLPPGDRD